MCNGVKLNGEPCRIKFGLYKGYCLHHFPCHGKTRDGKKCNAFVRNKRFGESCFCRDDHDPSKIRSTFPGEFRIDNLCHKRGEAVREYRNGQDVYSAIGIDEIAGKKELDHVVELHLVRDLYDSTVRSGSDLSLMDGIRQAINGISNLNFTSGDLNKQKFRAMDAFADDFRNDCVKTGGITRYLLDSQSKDKPFTRSVTRNISVEFRRSFDSFTEHLDQESSKSKFTSAFIENAQEMSVKLELEHID